MLEYADLPTLGAYLSLTYADATESPQHKAKWARDAVYFAGCKMVLDLGCGPGHFLGVMRKQGTAAYGVDTEPASYAACRRQGLAARKMDCLTHLRGLKVGSLPGLHCSNLLEHLPMAQALELLALAASRLAPGGRLVLSTANPACLGIMTHSFWDDPQHVRPWPASLLQRLAEGHGLSVEFAGPDELTRPQGPVRQMIRALRTALIGPYFEAPEVLLLARKP